MTDPDPWLVQYEARRAARKQQDRSFTVAGETLTVRPSVAPEVAVRYEELGARFSAYVTEVQAAEAAGKELPTRSGISDAEMLDVSEGTIRSCLDSASIAAWEKLRDPDAEDPLGLFDIYNLAGYVLAKVTTLPTVAPAASSNGRTPTAKLSKAASRSRAKTGSA